MANDFQMYNFPCFLFRAFDYGQLQTRKRGKKMGKFFVSTSFAFLVYQLDFKVYMLTNVIKTL